MTQAQVPQSYPAEKAVLGAMMVNADVLAKMAATLTEELFYFASSKVLFRIFVDLHQAKRFPDAILVMKELRSRGESERAGGEQTVREILDEIAGMQGLDVTPHVETLREQYALREALRIGEGMVKAVKDGKLGPKKILDLASVRLTETLSRVIVRERKTRHDFVAEELAAMNEEAPQGAPIPYNKIRNLTGDLIPGDAVAIPGYSNAGKTLFVANLAKHWAVKQLPAIWFPTESQRKFLSRVGCIHAHIPQRIPERNLWSIATEDQREAYEFAMQDLASCPWDIVPQRSISIEEIIAEASERRRQYDGMPVIVVVDHMHRLNYGGINPAFGVGDGTVRLRNWAGDDRYGGIILVMLYQPKKPDVDVNVYKPVSGYGISGSGQVMAELDIIYSPYRRWVKVEEDSETNPYHRTPWGTPKSLLKNGHPVAAKPESEGAKLDDEHVYVKISKQRTGGEGPTCFLHIDAPSGYIYQLEAHNDEHRGTGT